MSMYALLRSSKTQPSEDQIEECLSGNLCRCTGYRPILDAFRVFAKTDNSLYAQSSASSDGFICPSTGKPCSCGESKVRNAENSIKPLSFDEIDGSSYSDRELIFPPELRLRKSLPLMLNGFGGLKWFRPLRLQHVLDLKARYPEAKFVIGNTEVGIEVKFKNAQYPSLISLTHVPELNIFKATESGLEIGASLRLTKLQQYLREVIKEHTDYKTSSCKAILEQLKWFAGTQIKNSASIGGNICTASPISDLNPLWMASGAKFQVINCKGDVRTVLAKHFFQGYRKIDLASNEILLSVLLPWTRPFEFVKEFKQAHRREDDIALVNAGMRVFLEKDSQKWKVSDVSIVYGGVAAVSLVARRTENYLMGRVWDNTVLKDSLELLKEDVNLSENAPGGMVEFRRSLTLSFFFKFFLWIIHQMNEGGVLLEGIDDAHKSAIQPYSRPKSIGNQVFALERKGTAVGLPSVHLSARLQVQYADLYILSSGIKGLGKVKSILLC